MPKPPVVISPAIAATRALVDGSTHRVRLSRLRGADARGNLVYEGPDQIYLERASGGQVVLVTTQGQDWAEADEQDAALHDGKLSFTVEDYLLEILD